MREPTSEKLFELVKRLAIANDRDLKGLHDRVSRLAGDLPKFESVWIDALRSARLLTHFQANEIAAGRGEALKVGRYVVCHVVQECGYATVCKARDIESGGLVRLVTAAAQPSRSSENELRFDRLIELTARLPDVSGLATAAGNEGSRVWIASPWIEGTSLADWMLHHGRFPPEVVLEIARAIVQQLAAMESIDLVHGDIRAENILLLPDGRVCLPQPGVRGILRPHEGIAHCDLAPEACSTLAPERVSRGTPPDVASDLFACGCVWWQMLCGRPALGGGDSMARLRAAQSAAIDDFRLWSSDAPPELADALDTCLKKDPRRRPRSMAAICDHLRPRTRAGRQAIVRCLSAATSPRAPWLLAKRAKAKKQHPHLWTATTLLLLAAIGVAWPVWVAVNRPRVLAQSAQPAPTNAAASKSAANERPKRGTEPVAASSKQTSSVVPVGYLEPVGSPGGLHLPQNVGLKSDELKLLPGQIVRPQAGRTRLVVPPQGLTVTADRVTFEHIDFVTDGRLASDIDKPLGSRALVNLSCGECTFVDCSFQSAAGEPEPSAAVRWLPIEAGSAAALPSGRIRFRDCVFRRVATGIESSRRGAISIETLNVLHLGPGPFLRLRHLPAADEPLRISLSQITLRDASSLVELDCPAGSRDAPAGEICIDATGCVFAPRDGRSLLLIACDQPPAQLVRGLKWTGQGSVLSPRTAFAFWQRPDLSMEVIDDTTISISGLVRGHVDFGGPTSGRPSDSRVLECQAPLPDSESPGANTPRLPADVEPADPGAS
jgi:serine/threonine protein kinase